MRNEDQLIIGANPIFPVLKDQAAVSGKPKTGSADNALANLSSLDDDRRVRFSVSRNTGETANADGREPAGGGLSFADLIDVINPLQHIPVISTIYRSITGDEISPAAKVAGNALFLGPVGAVSALVDVAVDEFTGSDIGEHVVSWLTGDDLSETASNAVPATQVGAQAGAPSGNSAGNGQVLSATEPFYFGNATPSDNALPPETIAGFAGAAEPVALESLPADILAALYSGQPRQPEAGQPQTGSNFDNASNQAVGELPLWSLFAGPEDVARPQITPSAVSQAYGSNQLDKMAEIMNEPGTIGYQGGWFSTVMPDIVARYEQSATLQRQNLQPVVDVQQ